MILGSNRTVTSDFEKHVTAEDYTGAHKSEVSIVGTGKVIKVINKFKSHEDSINYDDFLKNAHKWKQGNTYNCISITGKHIDMTYDELGGNQLYIETYYNNSKIIMRFTHLDNILMKTGDIIKPNQVFAYQGNTGLVLDTKERTDETYGSQLHFEVTDENGKYINPRKFANGDIVTYYPNQQNNIVDKTESDKVNNENTKLTKDNKENSDIYEFLFKSPKEGYYYLKLYEGESLYIKKSS